MSIAFKGAAQAAANTVTIPTHIAGDFIIGVAMNYGSTIPTLPAGEGWNSQFSDNSGSNSTRWFWKFASSASESFGTATNADQVLCWTYSGVNVTDPIGDVSFASGTGTLYTLGNLTFEVTNGSSWMIGYAAMEGGTPNYVAASGTTIRLEEGLALILDSNGGLSDWNQETADIGFGIFTGQSAALELKAQPTNNFFAFM